MSSPFGHSLAGYIVSAYKSKTFRLNNVKILALYVLIANAPDLDFIPGILIGKPNLFHHRISHSLGAAALFPLVLLLVLKCKWLKSSKNDFILYSGFYCSHLFLDYISVDGRPPFGVPLFWPLSHEYFILPHPVLPAISHSQLDHATVRQFIDGVFSLHNLNVMFLEATVITPFILLIWSLNKRLVKRSQSVSQDMLLQ